MIFSTDKDFLQGWDDYEDGNTIVPASVINPQMWQDGYNAHKKYHLSEADDDALFELTDID